MPVNIRSSIPNLSEHLQGMYDSLDNVFSTYFKADHIKLGYKVKADDIYNCLFNLIKMTLYSSRIARKYIYPLAKHVTHPDDLDNEFHFGLTYAYNRGTLQRGIFQDSSGNNSPAHAIPLDQSSKLLVKVQDDSKFIIEECKQIDNRINNLLNTLPSLCERFQIIRNTKIIGENTRNFILQMYGYATQLRDTILYIVDNRIVQIIDRIGISNITITDVPNELLNITDTAIDGYIAFFHNYSILTRDAIGNNGISENNFLYNYEYGDNENRIYVPSDVPELSALSHAAVVNTCLGSDGCLSNYLQLSAYSEYYRAPLDNARFHPSGRCRYRTKIIVSNDAAVSPNYRDGSWIRTSIQNRSDGAFNTGIVGLLLGLDDITRNITNNFTGFFTNLHGDPSILSCKFRIRYYFNNSGGNTYYNDEFYPMFSLYHLKNFFDIWSVNEYGQTAATFNNIPYYWSIHGPKTFDQDFNQKVNNTIICATKSAVAGNPSYSNGVYTLNLYPVFAFEIVYHFDYNFDSSNIYTDYVTMNVTTYTVRTTSKVAELAHKRYTYPANFNYSWTYYYSNGSTTTKHGSRAYNIYTDNKHWTAFNKDKRRLSNVEKNINKNGTIGINDIKSAIKIHLFPSFYINAFNEDAGTRTTSEPGIRWNVSINYSSFFRDHCSLTTAAIYNTQAEAQAAASAGRGSAKTKANFKINGVASWTETWGIASAIGGAHFDSAKGKWYIKLKLDGQGRSGVFWGYEYNHQSCSASGSYNPNISIGGTSRPITKKETAKFGKQEVKKTS